ncbi:hypothetical protein BsWGS_10419 [Bradybaena similaris]
MFHVGGHKGVGGRGRSSGFSRHYPHFMGHVNWKGPLRCGIIFCTISCVLFVIGVILTWLGVHDVLGESVPITGPILLAVGGLMLVLALRQFYMAHVRKIAHNKALQNKELAEPATAALTENSDDHDFTESDLNRNKTTAEGTGDPEEASSKTLLTSGTYYNSHAVPPYSPAPVSGGGYVWPPVPLQNTFYSMALLAYRDPKLLYGLYLSDTDRTATCATATCATATCATAPSATATCATAPSATATCATAPSATAPSATTTCATDTSQAGDSSTAAIAGDLPTSPHSQQRDTAVLETPSSTLQQQQTIPTSCSPPIAVSASRPDCSKIFPADHAKTQQRKHVASGIASAGISNLPNPTAFMMLRTLELQETI